MKFGFKLFYKQTMLYFWEVWRCSTAVVYSAVSKSNFRDHDLLLLTKTRSLALRNKQDHDSVAATAAASNSLSISSLWWWTSEEQPSAHNRTLQMKLQSRNTLMKTPLAKMPSILFLLLIWDRVVGAAAWAEKKKIIRPLISMIFLQKCLDLKIFFPFGLFSLTLLLTPLSSQRDSKVEFCPDMHYNKRL